MPTPPAQPKIYHITHVHNLPSIIVDGGLVSDAAMIARGGPATAIGMPTIKGRRLQLPVDCHPGDHVGDYAPFYFCPRSIMLYVIHCANHQELSYRGGQEPIVHLEADLHEVVEWANASNRRWAFSLSNAGAVYAQFRSNLDYLHEVDWAAVAATDFRSEQVKEGKQAEFLVRDFFPWDLVTRIGVRSIGTESKALAAFSAATHHPKIEVRPGWYY
jgi:hypothetical protein